MSEETIPTGKDAKVPQADGVPSERPPEPPASRPAEEPAPTPAAQEKPAPTPAAQKLPFQVAVTWSGAATGCGDVRVGGALSLPIGGAKELGGCGKGANPEELLLAAVGACFVNTWAIFLGKLQLDYPDPSLRVEGHLEPDAAGGYRMANMRIAARVPAALLAGDRQKVEKTLALSEKYCIISKVVKAALPLSVAIEEVPT